VTEKIPFEKIDKFVFTGAYESAQKFRNEAGKFLMVYSVLSLVCLVLDFCVIFVGVADMNNESGAFGSVFVYLLGVLYFLIAFYQIGWVISVRMRLPVHM